MNFQRKWGLPRRALKSLWMLCPIGEDAELQRPPTSHLDQTWRNVPRGPSLEAASVGWPGGARSRERDFRRGVLGNLDPSNLRRLQLHLAKKHLEIHHGTLPTIAKASLQLADVYSKQPLPKPILSGQGLLQPRNLSPLAVSPEDKDHLEWVVQRNHFAFLWGISLRYRGALAGIMPKFTSTSPRHRLAQTDFSETQVFFLQMEDREVLEDHIKKKRIQHMWSCPVLVQRSMELFMLSAPLCLSTHKLEPNTRILLHEAHFLPPKTQTHLEHHIQRRKLVQKWGLPKKIWKSFKIFLPRAPIEDPKEPLEGPKNQKGKQLPPESLSKVASSVPASRPTKQQTFRFQGVEMLYLPEQEKEVLEHHIKKKRLQHQWGLPVVIQRSLQAFAPSPLGPALPPKKAGQDMKIQVQGPLFLPLHSRESSEAASKEAITSDGPSGKVEGNTEKGPLLAEEEGRISELPLQWVTAAERPPGEGGTQDGSVGCRVTGRVSPMAESPPAAESKRRGGKTWAQDTTGHTATPFGGEAPEHTQESFRDFLPQSRFHSHHKSTRVHFLTVAELDSHSRPEKSSPTYRSEVRLQLAPGGRIGSWVSTEEPSRSSSPHPLPIVEASEGGSSQAIQLEEGNARLSRPKGRSSSRDEPELTVPHVLLQERIPRQDWLTFSKPEDYGSHGLC